tara:strand:- start:317 stop:535 length:219 start_codon:yes stop_codon:yes gene_type:complete
MNTTTIAYKLAQQLKTLALETKHCPECLTNINNNLNKQNNETLISGLCTDCQKIYFREDDLAWHNNFGGSDE